MPSTKRECAKLMLSVGVAAGMVFVLWACGGTPNGPTAPEDIGAESLELASPKGSTTLNERFPLAFAIDNPCTPAVESIQLEGDDHLIIRSVLDHTGTEHVFLHFNIHLTGSDGDGITYTLNESHAAHGKTAPTGDLVFQASNYMRVVSDGAAPNFRMKATFRILRSGAEVFEGGETICGG